MESISTETSTSAGSVSDLDDADKALVRRIVKHPEGAPDFSDVCGHVGAATGFEYNPFEDDSRDGCEKLVSMLVADLRQQFAATWKDTRWGALPVTRSAWAELLVDADAEALGWMVEACYRYAWLAVEGPNGRWRQGLVFEESGKVRLAATLGWIVGLSHGGQEALAKRLAGVKLPCYRITLADDGTLGGFSLLWHHGITAAELWAKAESSEDWNAIQRRLEVRSNLTLSALVPQPERGSDHVWVHYRPEFVGGLLYHGPGGGEVFAVDLDKAFGREVLFSIHT